MPLGSTRYWSWLFATAALRAPLLGIYALVAEWHALMDPASDSSVAHLKLAWWQEEMRRLAAGNAVHPISRYLAALPNAQSTDFTALIAAVQSAATQLGGAPLERAAELEFQCRALCGEPMALACRLGAPRSNEFALQDCTTALAAGEYLANALADYRDQARRGRIAFAIDEMLSAGIENSDLAANEAPPHLQQYLDQVRQCARRYFELAADALPDALRSDCRHLLVLAALGSKHLNRGLSRAGRRPARDMLLAWSTARHALK